MSYKIDSYTQAQIDFARKFWAENGYPRQIIASSQSKHSTNADNYANRKGEKVAFYCYYNDGEGDILVQIPASGINAKARRIIANMALQHVEVVAYMPHDWGRQEITFEVGHKTYSRKLS